MTRKCGLILALDTPDIVAAAKTIDAVGPSSHVIKLGIEFFMANGLAGVQALRAQASRPVSLMLDFNLHDIPNTVAGAVRSMLPLWPAMLTLHASGGSAMIAAARRAVDRSEKATPLLLAVTVLTSLDDRALADIGFMHDARSTTLRMARMALDAGADGLVCSPHEIAPLRDYLGNGQVTLVVPGIRLAGASADDQRRTMTPREAAAAGANWIVVGRPITKAPNPAEAAAAIFASLNEPEAGP